MVHMLSFMLVALAFSRTCKKPGNETYDRKASKPDKCANGWKKQGDRCTDGRGGIQELRCDKDLSQHRVPGKGIVCLSPCKENYFNIGDYRCKRCLQWN